MEVLLSLTIRFYFGPMDIIARAVVEINSRVSLLAGLTALLY